VPWNPDRQGENWTKLLDWDESGLERELEKSDACLLDLELKEYWL
jgi:hypothetical protein